MPQPPQIPPPPEPPGDPLLSRIGVGGAPDFAHHLLEIHQAIDLNVPIGCGDVAVFPGDIVVGDQEGVAVIPAHMAEDIAAEATEMTAYEDFVTEEVKNGKSVRGLYPATTEETVANFAKWRERTGR